MNNLVIQATKSTPTVDFNRETGLLRLVGASYPENAFAFYKPILEWLKDFSSAANGRIELGIDLKYLNTSSLKCLMNLIRILERIPNCDTSVAVRWFYDSENETILEIAEEFRDDSRLRFSIEVK